MVASRSASRASFGHHQGGDGFKDLARAIASGGDRVLELLDRHYSDKGNLDAVDSLLDCSQVLTGQELERIVASLFALALAKYHFLSEDDESYAIIVKACRSRGHLAIAPRTQFGGIPRSCYDKLLHFYSPSPLFGDGRFLPTRKWEPTNLPFLTATNI